MDYCLRNKPASLFDAAECGNMFVEPGEECDCGLPGRCDNPCCNPHTCRLHVNATCATGACCDLGVNFVSTFSDLYISSTTDRFLSIFLFFTDLSCENGRK